LNTREEEDPNLSFQEGRKRNGKEFSPIIAWEKGEMKSAAKREKKTLQCPLPLRPGRKTGQRLAVLPSPKKKKDEKGGGKKEEGTTPLL